MARPRADDARASSAVATRSCVFTVALHPSALADPLAGARAVLDAMKMRHVDALGGVLMAYDDEALCGARRRERDDDGDDDGDDETSTSESDDAEADDDLDKSWATVGWEAVVDRNPEVIVIVNYGEVTAEQKRDFMMSNPAFTDIDAVHNDRFVVLEYVEATPGPRNIEAVKTLAAAFRAE
mgnify:CR=1 FL=1